jgi:hypothetical protein
VGIFSFSAQIAMGRISCILSDFPLENILKDLKDFEPAELKKQQKKQNSVILLCDVVWPQCILKDQDQ